MQPGRNNYSVGYSLTKKLLLTEQEIIEQARKCGDENFIHNNKKSASNTRFKGLIASGSAVAAQFSAILPTHFSKNHDVLGFEMSFQFKAPIFPDNQYHMTWLIEDISGDMGKSGQVISLSGKIHDKSEVTQVLAKAKILLLEKL
ncbi:MAG: MaoC/PaaZ C-terminal domain-containing protein [Bermanella sp.]